MVHSDTKGLLVSRDDAACVHCGRTQVKTIDDKVKQIVEMGFSEADARDALNKQKGDPQAALELLLSK